MSDPGRTRTGTALRALLRPQQGLSPALIQFHSLLQRPLTDLAAAVAQELAESPALEADESPDLAEDRWWPLAPPVTLDAGDIVPQHPADLTLRDHLVESLHLTCGPALCRIGRVLIEEIDHDGLFRGDVAEPAARLSSASQPSGWAAKCTACAPPCCSWL